MRSYPKTKNFYKPEFESEDPPESFQSFLNNVEKTHQDFLKDYKARQEAKLDSAYKAKLPPAIVIPVSKLFKKKSHDIQRWQQQEKPDEKMTTAQIHEALNVAPVTVQEITRAAAVKASEVPWCDPNIDYSIDFALAKHTLIEKPMEIDPPSPLK